MNSIKKLRYSRGEEIETQTKMADRIGITQQNLSKLEREKHKPDLETLRKFYKVYGIELIEGILND